MSANYSFSTSVNAIRFRTKIVFSTVMLAITPLALGLAFYAIYKNPAFVPLVFIGLIPASLSCIASSRQTSFFSRRTI